MVSFEERGAPTVKIIDLGLAKAIDETGTQTAISMLGGFAGTPEFASPEQFAGVDIRSDLYSLGATLWKALTGEAVFNGSPVELIVSASAHTVTAGKTRRCPATGRRAARNTSRKGLGAASPEPG